MLVPAFAIDRTEGVLRALVQLRREGRIPKDLPVIVDGPMSIRALRAYRLFPEEIGDDFDIGDFTELNLTETEETHESKQINRRKDPLLIVSSSGMLEGGRVLYHLERLLPDPRNTVILTGFQAPGTRGRQLLNGATAIKVNGRYIPVRAEIVADREFSVHADASDLMDWLRALSPPPETVFVTHGEPEAAAAFARRIEEDLGWTAVVPNHGEIVTVL